jgi:hypothetical protein
VRVCTCTYEQNLCTASRSVLASGGSRATTLFFDAMRAYWSLLDLRERRERVVPVLASVRYRGKDAKVLTDRGRKRMMALFFKKKVA